jgi:hypothetical protein
MSDDLKTARYMRLVAAQGAIRHALLFPLPKREVCWTLVRENLCAVIAKNHLYLNFVMMIHHYGFLCKREVIPVTE